MISQAQKQAAYEYLVQEMDAGRVGEVVFWNTDGSPCCSMGHIAWFLNGKEMVQNSDCPGRTTENFLYEAGLVNSLTIGFPNDDHNYPQVLRLLRDAWGLEEEVSDG